jgi:hypothetical protein
MACWRILDVAVWNTVLSLLAPSMKKSYELIFFRFGKFFEQENMDFRSLSLDVLLRFCKLSWVCRNLVFERRSQR